MTEKGENDAFLSYSTIQYFYIKPPNSLVTEHLQLFIQYSLQHWSEKYQLSSKKSSSLVLLPPQCQEWMHDTLRPREQRTQKSWPITGKDDCLPKIPSHCKPDRNTKLQTIGFSLNGFPGIYLQNDVKCLIWPTFWTAKGNILDKGYPQIMDSNRTCKI